MAVENDNTGGNQAGAGSQGNAGAGQGQVKKKYLNKYDSLDDAVEKGIGGLEQGFHETRQQLKAIQDLLELAINPGSDNRTGFAPIGSRGADQGDQGYNRGPQAIEDTIDAAEWITSPGKALRRVNEARDRNLMNSVGNFVNQAVAGAMAVSDFKRENPDLIEHEHIVSHFMKNLDPRMALDKRLREAAKQTKAYLKSVRGNGKGRDDEAGRAPEGDEFVENPAGLRESDNRQAGDEGVGDNKDDTLDEYIAQRRKDKSKHFAPPVRNNS